MEVNVKWWDKIIRQFLKRKWKIPRFTTTTVVLFVMQVKIKIIDKLVISQIQRIKRLKYKRLVKYIMLKKMQTFKNFTRNNNKIKV